MSTSSPGGDVPIRRIDRVLAFMSLGLVLLSVICFFAIMIGSGAGVGTTGPLWQLVAVIPLIALPVAFAMMLAVIIMSFVRRARANRGD